jgi:hypothetical protein
MAPLPSEKVGDTQQTAVASLPLSVTSMRCFLRQSLSRVRDPLTSAPTLSKTAVASLLCDLCGLCAMLLPSIASRA